MADQDELADNVMRFADQMLRAGHDPERVGMTLAAAGVTVLQEFGGPEAVVRFVTGLADNVLEHAAPGTTPPG